VFQGFSGGGDIYGTEGRLKLQEASNKYSITHEVLKTLGRLGFPIGDVNGKEEDEGFWNTNVMGR
jgi:hypothetical protein